MARRKNPGTFLWLALLGGAGAAVYLVTRKRAVAAAPTPQAVLEPPAADQPPTRDELATTCYEEDRPLAEPGYEWKCSVSRSSGAQWKKRRISRQRATVLRHAATTVRK